MKTNSRTDFGPRSSARPGRGAPGPAQDRQVLNLSLEDCVAKALKNNLNVAVEKMTPELAGLTLAKAREIFLPQFSLSYGNDRQENPSNWWIQGAGTITSKLFDYGVSVAEMIPTGGSLPLSLQSYKSDTNQAFQLINPRFGSTLRFDFTQPLLKNFGPTVTKRQILQAAKNLDIAEKQLESTMLDTVYLVQEAYWNYVYRHREPGREEAVPPARPRPPGQEQEGGRVRPARPARDPERRVRRRPARGRPHPGRGAHRPERGGPEDA